jgi:tRNA dimethylallyltransferase
VTSGPIYIAGPTASGKSAVALLLAQKLGGEIISVDSMQVYRGMDIGTAKASPEERRLVQHHLIDIAEPNDSFDAAQFVLHAQHAESEIRSRGHIPIYCGGTGLYFNALLSGLGDAPPGSPELRRELENEPLEALLAELQTKDPQTFATIDKANPRRVVRAIEVIRLTGKPFSASRAEWKSARQTGHWFGIERQRADLCARIEKRVDEMFAAGLVEETRGLLHKGLEGNPAALQAIGYRQVWEHLRGERDLPATIEIVKQKTRQYSKRQMTWFKRQLQLKWIVVPPSAATEWMAEQIEHAI